MKFSVLQSNNSLHIFNESCSFNERLALFSGIRRNEVDENQFDKWSYTDAFMADGWLLKKLINDVAADTDFVFMSNFISFDEALSIMNENAFNENEIIAIKCQSYVIRSFHKKRSHK